MYKKVLFLIFALSIAFQCLASAPAAHAASSSDWHAGNIIDDPLFTDASSMSVSQIQAFLNNLNPNCDTNGTQPASDWGYPNMTHAQFAASQGWPGPPYVCLKNYYEVPKTAPGAGVPANNFSGSIPPGAISAAQMIYNAAQQNGISPKVLLVTIHKESSGPLTTDTWPLQKQYTYAMGAHCPDSGPGGSANCDPNYAGFSIQISESAALLRYYLDNMQQSWWTYKKPYQVNNILWNISQSNCGGSDVYISTKATAALYTYTPYQPNQAALDNLYGSGDGCSAYGNRNFWRIFTDWFGNTTLPTALKSTQSSAVYIQTNGYKFGVPSMAMLQDFGISPQSIQTVAQSTLDAIPNPDSSSSLSTNLGYVVKSPSDSDADGGAVYVISAGHRYAVSSMDQFSSFGFNTSNIAYLPLNYINSFPTGGALSNFISTPTSNVFQVGGAMKRIIFDYSTYKSLDPSNTFSYVSSAFAATVNSDAPITNREILVGMTSGAVYLLDNGTYYAVPSMATYSCWGFGSTQSTPLYRLSDDTFVAPPSSPASLSCEINTDQTTQYLLNSTSKVTVPASYGFSSTTPNQDLSTLANQLPTRTAPLARAIKSTDSAAIWYVDNGKRSSIPSMSDFGLLGFTTPQIDTLTPGAVNVLPSSGIKLGLGQVVKTNDNSTVYAITSVGSRTAIASGDDFVAYGYKWNGIESFPSTLLDQLYPSNAGVALNRYLYDQAADQIFLVDSYGCHPLTSSQVTSYGQDYNSIKSSQAFSSTVFPYVNLPNCKTASVYVKSPDQGTVYWIDAGTKRPVSSWSKLVTLSGQSTPYIITLSNSTLDSLPVGTPL